MQALGDAGVQSALRSYLDGLAVWNADDLLAGQARRLDILRAWSEFLERYPVLLMPNSWRRQFPVDADVGPPSQVQALDKRTTNSRVH